MGDGRIYEDGWDEPFHNHTHLEVHPDLQLPQEIVVGKSGEFREACPLLKEENGNPEPSLATYGGKVQRLEHLLVPRKGFRGKRPTP